MAINTNNYNLKKPSPEDFYNIEDHNGNMDVIDEELNKLNEDKAAVEHNHNGVYETPASAQSKADAAMESSNQYTDQKISTISTSLSSHLSDYVRQPGYGATAGSANTYTLTLNPAPTSYVDGIGIVVKINAANTGASTINVNGLGAKAIVDGKGNALTLGKLRLNGTYSLKYNSTSGNFILQGEGGEIPKLPNLIKNGSFENGLNCYASNGNVTELTVYAGTGRFGNNTLYQYHAAGEYQQILPYVVGHKYYMSGWAWLNQTIDPVYTAIGAIINNGIRSAFYTPNLTLSNWQFNSMVFTCNGALTTVIGTFGDNRISNVHFDGFMLFDLTDIFGAGNEPSKADVDAMVNQYGGWWDSDCGILTADGWLDPAYLVQGYSGYDDGLKKAGTMPNNGSNGSFGSFTSDAPTNSVITGSAGNQWVGAFDFPLNGFYAGTWRLHIANLLPQYIQAGIRVGSSAAYIEGTNTNKKWASGTIANFYSPFASSSLNPVGTISGLGFSPKTIIFSYYRDGNYTGFAMSVNSIDPTVLASGFTMFQVSQGYNKIAIASPSDFLADGFTYSAEGGGGSYINYSNIKYLAFA